MIQHWQQRNGNNIVNRSVIDEYNPVVFVDADLWSGKCVVLVLHLLRKISLHWVMLYCERDFSVNTVLATLGVLLIVIAAVVAYIATGRGT